MSVSNFVRDRKLQCHRITCDIGRRTLHTRERKYVKQLNSRISKKVSPPVIMVSLLYVLLPLYGMLLVETLLQ